MKKANVLKNPTRITDLSFDDLYEEISSDWELKAERLQARRWHELKHKLTA